MILHIKRIYWALLHRFVVNKKASTEHAKFHVQNTFIMPTRFGWSIIGVTLCLFVLGTNYQNNVILAVSYLLVAIVLLAIFHNYFFFIQHQLDLEEVNADFENRRLKLRGTITTHGQYSGGELSMQIARSFHKFKVTATSEKTQTFEVKLPKFKRGIHQMPLITVSAIYGFGFFRCWSYIVYPNDLIVYPSVERAPTILHNKLNKESGSIKSSTQMAISDNLQGIRPHVKTDPIHHVSWKHVAKGQGLVSKDFSENAGATGWLKLSDYAHLDIENALKIICFQIQELAKSNVVFGLDLGVTKVLPNSGNKHLDECLLHLAAFGSSDFDARAQSI